MSGSGRNDCFFVTAGRLTNTTPANVSQRTGVPIPPPGRPGGISGPQMSATVRTLGGVAKGREQPKPRKKDENTGPLVSTTEARKARVKPLSGKTGVAFTRPDRGGHVVVGSNVGTPYARYTDYQANNISKRNAAQDVKKSKQALQFSLPKASRDKSQPMDLD